MDNFLDIGFTVFVPDNKAMKDIVLPADPWYICTYHMVSGYLPPKRLEKRKTLFALQGDEISYRNGILNGEASIVRSIEVSSASHGHTCLLFIEHACMRY